VDDLILIEDEVSLSIIVLVVYEVGSSTDMDLIVTTGQDESRVLAVEVEPGLLIREEASHVRDTLYCLLRENHERVRAVSIVPLHHGTAREVLASWLRGRIGGEGPIFDQGPSQGRILLALSRTSSVGSVLGLALLNTEAFDWSSRNRFALINNNNTSTKESCDRSWGWGWALFLRLGRRKRRSAASPEETSRFWALALALSLLFGRGRVGRLGGHCDL